MATTPRRIIAQLAVSADGYIARPDGDVEWLNRRPQTTDYGLKAFVRSVDTVLMGRGTYDWAMAYARKHNVAHSLIFDPNLANVVFSRRPAPRRPAAGVTFTRGPVKRVAARLRATPGKHVWLMGGGGLIASFLDAGEVDELDLHVIPTLIGRGIPLMKPRHRDIDLRLLATRNYPDGVVRLRYAVPRPRGEKGREKR